MYQCKERGVVWKMVVPTGWAGAEMPADGTSWVEVK